MRDEVHIDDNFAIVRYAAVDVIKTAVILALKVILLDRLHGINCSVIQEP